jgi:hypothetical protein
MLYLFGEFRVRAKARSANPPRALRDRNAERVRIVAAVLAQVFGCFEAAAASLGVQHGASSAGSRSLKGADTKLRTAIEETGKSKQLRQTFDSKVRKIVCVLRWRLFVENPYLDRCQKTDNG